MVCISLYINDVTFRQDIESQIMRFINDVVFSGDSPDIAIIDEDESVFFKIRKENPLIPIVLLSSMQANSSQEYLNIIIKKPFVLMKFLDILRAANNRLDNSSEGYLLFNNYELRPKSKSIVDMKSGKIVRLTEKEIDILKYLYKTRDNYVSKNDLQKNVWQYNDDVTTHTIETHMYRVRQKVERVSGRRLILTLDGGYKLNTGE